MGLIYVFAGIILNLAYANGELTLAQLNTRLTELSAKVDILEASSVSTYIRWGKKTCPGNGTSLVYSGFAGGSQHSVPGGQALCMLPNPIFMDEGPVSTEGSAKVYGVRYNTVEDSTSVNKDMSCSLCKTSRSTVIMLPGLNICHAGWTLEYNGWLVADASGDSSSEYICLDRQPEALTNNEDSNDVGCLFNPVKSKCGSLPCPPYLNDKTLSCAVCSK